MKNRYRGILAGWLKTYLFMLKAADAGTSRELILAAVCEVFIQKRINAAASRRSSTGMRSRWEETRQLPANLISLCLRPVINRHFLSELLDIKDEEAYDMFLDCTKRALCTTSRSVG